MKTILKLIAFLCITLNTQAQLGPEVTSWIINTTGTTGYAGIPSNVQSVKYSSLQVYISCTGIPSYTIGPWAGQPNVPVNQNFVFKITRSPQQNTTTPTAIGLGHIGVFKNGVSIFNVSDGQSYNNAGIWNRNAYYWEGSGFDDCLGHPQQQGEYHHHVSPKCLYDINDSTVHSPIIGFAFDGFPIYGAYAYTNTNGTGAVKRMVSSYTLSLATTRMNGPAVSSSYPAGCFIEDHVFTQGAGDLDARNGRYCVTPEYPNGTYAYFVTLDKNLLPAFPYTFFGSYYGVLQSGNTGPGSGHNTISEPTTTYSSVISSVANIPMSGIYYKLMPNPTHDFIFIEMDDQSAGNVNAGLYDATGKLIQSMTNMNAGTRYQLDLASLPNGIYSLQFVAGREISSHRIIKSD